MRPLTARALIAASLLALSLPAVCWAVLPPDTQRTAPAAAETFASDVKEYRQHITTLGNPFMEGRAPGSRGNRTAADYLEFHFQQLGLEPAFPKEVKQGDETVSLPFSSFRQVFKAPPSGRPEDRLKLVEQRAAYAVDGKERALVGGRDYNVVGYSADGEVTGPVVFAGYSLDIEEKEYSSYPVGTDLTGKIVMIFRFEPMDAQGKSLWSEDEEQPWTTAAGLEAKFREALYHKAAGIVLVNPPGAADDRAGKLEGLAFGGRQQKVPVVMMSREAADEFVRAADGEGRSLMDLRKLADKQGGLVEFKPDVELALTAKLEKREFMTDNVGAVLRGQGKLADEYIVIGAHYDHVGYGWFGSRNNDRGKLHPGADDNASGTSGVLLVARKLAEEYAKLPPDEEARSVLFIGFCAEESGLIGSRFYTKNMIAPKDKHYLMINMDMIGRLRDDSEGRGKLEVGGVNTAGGLKKWLSPYWEASGLNVKQSNVGAPNSDHFSFYSTKIPALFFFSGLHPEYHSPADVVDLINVEGAARVADLAFRVAMDAAQRGEPLVFQSGTQRDGGEEADEAPKADSHAGVAAGDDADPAQRPARRVRFGIMPGDYSDEKPGVLVGDVIDGLPAKKAGLRAGDRLTKWGDTPLKDVMSLQECMEKSKPGETVTITFVREGKEQTVDVPLVGAANPVR
jgi:Zn-dependent M28 family amino/carboxypeptidase